MLPGFILQMKNTYTAEVEDKEDTDLIKSLHKQKTQYSNNSIMLSQQ